MWQVIPGIEQMNKKLQKEHRMTDEYKKLRYRKSWHLLFHTVYTTRANKITMTHNTIPYYTVTALVPTQK